MEVGGAFSIQDERYFAYDATVPLYTKCNTVTHLAHTWKKVSLHSIAGIIGSVSYIMIISYHGIKVRYMLLLARLVKPLTARGNRNNKNYLIPRSFKDNSCKKKLSITKHLIDVQPIDAKNKLKLRNRP